jgi:hypothetical protein
MFRNSAISFAVLPRSFTAPAVHRAWAARQADAELARAIAAKQPEPVLECPLCGKTGDDVLRCCGWLMQAAA